MSDLVKRLRDLAQAKHDDLSIGDEAADRIAELEKAVIQSRLLTKLMKPQADRIAKLEAALRPFAGMADFCEKDNDSERACVFVGDLRAARAALEGGKR